MPVQPTSVPSAWRSSGRVGAVGKRTEEPVYVRASRPE